MGLVNMLRKVKKILPFGRSVPYEVSPVEVGKTVKNSALQQPGRFCGASSVCTSALLQRELQEPNPCKGVDFMLDLDALYRSNCLPILWGVQTTKLDFRDIPQSEQTSGDGIRLHSNSSSAAQEIMEGLCTTTEHARPKDFSTHCSNQAALRGERCSEDGHTAVPMASCSSDTQSEADTFEMLNSADSKHLAEAKEMRGVLSQQTLEGELQPGGFVSSGLEPGDHDQPDVSQEAESARDSHNDLAAWSEDVWAEEDEEAGALDHTHPETPSGTNDQTASPSKATWTAQEGMTREDAEVGILAESPAEAEESQRQDKQDVALQDQSEASKGASASGGWVEDAALVALRAIYVPLHLNLLGARRMEETVCSALSSVVGPSVVPRAGFGASTAAIRALTTAEELSAMTAGAAVGFCSSLGPLMRGKENGRGTLRSC